MSYYSSVNATLVDLSDPTARIVVELGCGEGAAAKVLKCSNPNRRFIGIEFMPGPAAKARAVFDTVIEGNVEDATTFSALDAALGEDRIDLLVIGDVLEHLHEPWSVMSAFHKRMSERGRMVLSLPNVSHWSLIFRQLQGDWTYSDSGLLDRTHLRYFTKKTGQDMLRQANWHITSAHPRVFNHKHRDRVIGALTGIAGDLGISAQRMREELSTLQWVHCASATPESRAYNIHAIGIAGALDSLTTVRLDQPLRTLRAMGRADFQLSRGSFALPHPSARSGILLTYRLHPTNEQWDQLDRLLASGWLFVHDVDDHPAYLRAQKRLDFRSIREAHAVTVSTEHLADVCRQWNENVFVVPNQIHALAPPELALATPQEPRVFFGAVNRSDQWQEGSVDQITTFARENRIETTVIADDSFAAQLGETAHHLPVQSYQAYRRELAQSDIALLPLRASAFTACKSDLKIIECLASGVVPLCSSYAAAQSKVPTEVLAVAEGPDDWVSELQRLRNPSVRAKMQAAGYRWVAENRLWAQHGHGLDDLYDRLYKQRSDLQKQRLIRLGRSL
ncbi:methyltransferase domain-containing protein [Palleronia caenipelagi]|uniref:Methyltransferase domain-containing protein n=1 Tax=Palleronia caenipelagi TaxID=2489174 RepID=A0A547PMA2_9RHOB|nr:methyltransferase domain-containing protein [Palleronia caenipelagi]TRD15282.1 methyltransferase domain-containing protein [Palleronia caenipelagi]